MKKHLEKLKKCDRKLDSYKYNDSELYNISLIRIKNNNKNVSCNMCNKKFVNIYTLKRHQLSCHENKCVNTDFHENNKEDINIEFYP